MDIKGYEGLYKINDNFEIESLDRYKTNQKGNKIFIKGIILKQFLDNWGYKQVYLYKNGKKKTIKVHRIIAEAFIPNPEHKETVNHINGIKTDNRIENLEWCTNKENFNHAIKNGLVVHYGENNKLAKLTDNKVREIFKLRKSGMTHINISKIFGVSRPVISNILARKYWKHVNLSTE